MANFLHQRPCALYVTRVHLKIGTDRGDLVVSRKVYRARSGRFRDGDGRDGSFLRSFHRVDSTFPARLGRRCVTDIYKDGDRHLSTRGCSGISKVQDAQADLLWCL